MNRAFRSFFFALVCVAAGTWLLCTPRGPKTVPPGPAAAPSGPAAGAPAPSVSPAPPAPRSSIGFRSRTRLDEHFAKHGAEFAAATANDYLAMAQRVRALPPSATVLELTRPTDGVISKFDRESGAFLAFDADSTIRTFFKPNDGEAYFKRQARRSPRS
ncbi:hypothetical protein [Gemmatimonas sp.]|uniref:hypothetical protein n=1 Tax=Gemmatimonas sp. TaxID=1962908 RepID=UPI003DA4338A